MDAGQRPYMIILNKKKQACNYILKNALGLLPKGGLFPYQRRCAVDVDERPHDVAEAEGLTGCIDVEGLAVRRVYAGQGAVEGIGLLPLIGVERRLVFVDLANQPARLIGFGV